MSEVLQTFNIPKSLQEEAQGAVSISFAQLTVGQEVESDKLMAATKDPYKKIAMSLRKVGDRTLDWGKGEPDEWLSAVSMKVRQLCMLAFNKVNMPQDEDVTDFLASMTISV